MQKIAIIGTTSWGITLGILLGQKSSEVKIWTRTEKEAVKLTKKGLDHVHFPNVSLPEQVVFTSRMEEALHEVDAVILAVPSASMRQNISQTAKYLQKTTVIISAAKGMEIGSNKRMSEVISEEINPRYKTNICVLSGPNLAREIAQSRPAAAVIASEDKNTARRAQKLLTSPGFCIFTNTDVIGVELGGALKNIIALGAGIADGLGYGDNAKAAFMTRGWTEITALGMALGANPLTFSGLAGLGDVIATCASPLSRNHFVGEELAKGRPITEILESMTEVAEGVNTTLVAHNLAQQLRLEMPITEKIYQILYENADPNQSALELMGGNVKHELAGRRWQLFSLFRQKKGTAAPDANSKTT